MALIAIAAMLVGGVAYYLTRTQSTSRAQLRTEFGRRAELAANLTAATISANISVPAELRREFGGSPAQVRVALRAYQTGSADPVAGVLDAQGRVVASWPQGSDRLAAPMADTPDVQRALRTGSALSDIFFWGARRLPMLRYSAAFATGFGRRVYVDVGTAQTITAAAAFLSSAPAVSGARAYLLDGAGRVLASADHTPQAALLPDRALARAIDAHTTGDFGGTYFVTAPIRAGTNWHILFASSESALYAPLAGSRRSGWLLFAAFVAAVIALLVLAASVFRKSAQLTGAREREQAAQRLAHERLHDSLTGLPNRALFLDRTQHALARIGRNRSPLAVLFVDLDHFKRINDSLGHASGDELLSMFGQRLQSAIRPSDSVSRFGGDEFLILCEELAEREDLLRIATRIHAVLEEPFTIGARQLHLTCCVGIAIQHPDRPVRDAAVLVRDADAAMYAAKSCGRGRVKVFDEELHRDAVRRLDTEVALRAAIAKKQLDVHYQPIVVLPDGALCGVEALARWNRPGVGAVPPVEFIPLAEECEFIDELGHWVLSTAMDEVERWHVLGLVSDQFWLSVNVSPRQLANESFPELLEGLLEVWSLPPSSLCLEITESAVAKDAEVGERALVRLSRLGVRLAIDDFGVGQSSLDQLVHSLPVDILKLDRAFVADMDGIRERAVVAAVAPMAGDLGMAAIAEGVETPEQARKLTALGYPLAQGYLFGRPKAAELFRAELTSIPPDAVVA